MTLNGSIALVTGGGGSIGGAVCRRLAREGAAVAVCDLFLESAQAVASEIVASGGKALALRMDVTDADDIAAVFDQVIQAYGKLDILVTVAGGSARSRIRHLREQEISVIDEMLAVNLRGAMLCMRQAAIRMAAQRSGKIINTTSIVGMQGKAGLVEYAAAKAGILAASKSLALEMGAFNVNVNCVSPGLVPRAGTSTTGVDRTNVFNRLCTPDDIAHMIHYLATEEAAFITGQNFVVDGGRSLGLRGDS